MAETAAPSAGTAAATPALVLAPTTEHLPNRSAASLPEQTPATETPATVNPPESPPVDVWERIRNGFALPPLRNQYVEYYEKWYGDHEIHMAALARRATPYLYYIVEEVEKRGLPSEIALLPVIESAFKPNAYSRARAAGLWQFIPSTGRRFGLKQNWWYDGRRDVISATRAALDYLEFLHDEFDGDWFHALAAYNAGERRVQNAIRHNRKRGRDTHYTALRLKSETRRYVPKLIAVRNIVLNPDKFGLTLGPIANEPYFAAVDAGSQIDLNIVATTANISRAELRRLNPAFRRWATDPEGPHRVLVPVDRKYRLERALAAIPKSRRMRYAHHAIRRGESLSTIARRYGVSIRAIQNANSLRGTRIRAGRSLLIPVSTRAYASARKRPKPRRAASGNQRQVVHRVRSGDTLWGIARRYDVYVKQLRRWNALSSNLLQLGQKIVIYTR